MSYQSTNLFAELTANGNTVAYEAAQPANEVSVFLQEGANDGGGTLKMQSSPDGGTTWVDVPTASWTSGDGHLGTYDVHGQDIRFNLASATGPSGMVVQISVKAKTLARVQTYALTADGNTANILLGHKPTTVTMFGDGTWGSGTAKLQYTMDGGTTWYDAGSLTADGGARFDNTNVGATIFRINLAGATSPDLNFWVIES